MKEDVNIKTNPIPYPSDKSVGFPQSRKGE